MKFLLSHSAANILSSGGNHIILKLIQNYKVIILIILFIGMLATISFLAIKNSNLSVVIANQEVTIIGLNSKIVENTTVINLLSEDQKNKESIISALQTQILNNAEVCRQTVSQLEELHRVSNTSTDVSKKEIKKGDRILNEKSSTDFVRLRNSIYDTFK